LADASSLEGLLEAFTRAERRYFRGGDMDVGKHREKELAVSSVARFLAYNVSA